MGDVINFCSFSGSENTASCNSEPNIIFNHLVGLDEDLNPVVEGCKERTWYGVIEKGFHLETETISITLLAAFLKEDHAEVYANGLSTNFGGYLEQDIIFTIQSALEE